MKYLLLVFCFFCLIPGSIAQGTAEKPNIIFILADDLGYGDLGSYGQKKIQTPNLDRLAARGMRFTQFYAGSPVCAPSRSALMSGQHSGHTYIRGNKAVDPEGQAPLPDSVLTLAEVLKQGGYATGAFGKWGLGFIQSSGDPLNQGFDTFYGYNCQNLAHRYYPDHLWDNDRKIVLEGNGLKNKSVYAPDLIQQQALAFLDNNKNKPFFLFLPYILPHAELIVPEDSLLQMYKGKFAEIPFKGNDYGPNATSGGYASQAYPRATYAAMVSRLDVYAGQIMQKVKSLGLEENTLIIFASDNGPAVEGGATPDFFNSNGSLKGYKRDVYEGGIRVPLIVSWPGKIKPKSTNSHPAAMWDLLPTFAGLAGLKNLKVNDGISLLPVFTGEREQPQHKFLYWEFHELNGKQAVRKGKWKAVKLNAMKDPLSPLELYDLDNDPAEKINLASKYPKVVKELENLLRGARTPSGLFPFSTIE